MQLTNYLHWQNAKKLMGDELWMQKVAIYSTNAVDAPRRYTLTASALLECIDAVSVMACILFGMTIRLAHLQQPIDAHKIKKSSKIKIFIYKVTCILCSPRYVGVIRSGLDKKEHVERS